MFMKRLTTYRPMITITLVAASITAIPPALAQDAFPSRAVTLIVPFSAGSGTDLVARVLAKGMSEQLNAPVIVDNKVGANGAIGALAAAKSKADGHTLIIGSATTHAVNFGFFSGKLGYEPEQFYGVAGLSFNPVSLYVEATAPWKSLSDLVADAKRNPGKFNCGSGNAVTQVACEVFRTDAGVQANNIPYKSNPQSLTDVVGKQVSYAFSDGGAAQAFVEGKRLRALAVASAARNSAMPEVPTFREQGVNNFEFTAWVAVFAPTGVPVSVLERLNATVRKAMDTPEMVHLIAKSGGTAMRFNSAAETQTFYKSEVSRWVKYVKDSGVKPEL
jgi:tripartite-type tricarboxylate transporter receptor subunit TctC